jgi:hypothetical protein
MMVVPAYYVLTTAEASSNPIGMIRYLYSEINQKPNEFYLNNLKDLEKKLEG